jgi:hypothetical protein
MNFYGLKNDRGIIGERETRTKSDRQDGPLEPIWQEARGNCLTWARLDTVLYSSVHLKQGRHEFTVLQSSRRSSLKGHLSLLFESIPSNPSPFGSADNTISGSPNS